MSSASELLQRKDDMQSREKERKLNQNLAQQPLKSHCIQQHTSKWSLRMELAHDGDFEWRLDFVSTQPHLPLAPAHDPTTTSR
mmetsp:Transcript_59629/g.96435  ORF Transcript_59629/g.96435 Transcript_59629/m.96435 type:complete len:83 (+) Transcript_59629:57-305(+)